jgi:hypothetical protein
LYRRIAAAPNPAVIVVSILEAARAHGISPSTVWKGTCRYAEVSGMSVPELDIYGAATNYDKTVKSVAEVLFGEDIPAVEKYISDTKPWFGSRFFDALRRHLREEGKGPSAVQKLLGIAMSDAKGVWGNLVHV